MIIDDVCPGRLYVAHDQLRLCVARINTIESRENDRGLCVLWCLQGNNKYSVPVVCEFRYRLNTDWKDLKEI